MCQCCYDVVSDCARVTCGFNDLCDEATKRVANVTAATLVTRRAIVVVAEAGNEPRTDTDGRIAYPRTSAYPSGSKAEEMGTDDGKIKKRMGLGRPRRIRPLADFLILLDLFLSAGNGSWGSRRRKNLKGLIRLDLVRFWGL